MSVVKFANEALRFLLELAALVAFGYWGFKSGAGNLMKWVLAIGIPLLAAVIWGTFGSPRAAVKLSRPLHLVFEVMFFGLAVASLYTARKPGLALAFGLIFAINEAMLYIWRQ